MMPGKNSTLRTKRIRRKKCKVVVTRRMFFRKVHDREDIKVAGGGCAKI